MDSRFISETAVEEAKQKRQEEWEKVRKPEDPEMPPESNEPYDPRSLFTRLQEQKQKKDLEYEETHKLKNLIRGLDDDEVQFLDFVEQKKLDADKQKELEEISEINDYREKIATLQEQNLDTKIQLEIAAPKTKNQNLSANRLSQKQLLTKGVVQKRKSEASGSDAGQATEPPVKASKSNYMVQGSALKCIGILPGLESYTSDDSDNSSSSDSDGCERTDWVGRKVTCKDAQHGAGC